MRRQITVLSLVVGILTLSSAGLAGPQVLEVSPTFLGFSASAGGANPASQVLSIWNSGHAQMGWTVTEDCNWLTVDPNAGSSSGEVDDVNVIVDISGLSAGTYNCQLTVDAGTAADSPQIVDVNLTVIGPILEVSATQFEFTAFEGGANPADQILNISNSGGGTLNWEISEDCNWLTANPTSGSSTGEIDDVNIIVDISGLVVGIYVCNLMVWDVNAANSPQTVGVTLSVGAEGILLVPTEYENIQAAIDASINGDTVVVAPGIYTGAGNRDLDFGGLAITVRSTNPEDPCVVVATVIDCENVSGRRGFYFHSGEGPNSIVSGFTIKRGKITGSPARGGGIYCSGASPTITNCVITNNMAEGDAGYTAAGGGIYCIGGSSTVITGCTISNNTAMGGIPGNAYGGGIFGSADSFLLIKLCNIKSNLSIAGVSGGGIGYGGGIYGRATVSDCIVMNNDTRSTYQPYGGGGYFLNGSSVINCLFTGNDAADTSPSGAGIYGINMTMIHSSTICNNTFSLFGGSGGGIYCNGATAIADCIVWGNESSEIGGSPIVTYSDVEGGYSGTGNINSDPCFVSGPEGDYYLSQTAAGQAVDSPCVDAGSDTAANLWMDIFTTRTDIVGDGGIVDMGYHYPIPNPPDIDGDGDIDFVDFAILASQWRQVPSVPSADIMPPGGDNIVDFLDVGLLFYYWLWEE